MNATIVKEALSGRAEEFVRWLFPAGKLNGREWQVGSLGGEAGKSCSIRVRGEKVGVFKDFATGESGNNLIELFSLARNVKFKEALWMCRDWLGLPPCTPERRYSFSTMPRVPEPSSAYPAPMAALDCERALAMAATLRANPVLCERMARARGWRVETFLDLAREPSLGWHHGRLAFLYESGAKLRWRENGERVIRWAFGKPWLWRGGFLWGRSTIYLCEGETDAISLIDAGIENDGSALAVGLPSCSTFDEEWAQLFCGKDVVLALDADKAGHEATERLSRFLQPFVNTLKRLNWGGLQRAS